MSIQQKQWDDLKEEIRKRIDEIDHNTPWQESEPKWWLEMMYIDKVIRNSKNKED